MRLVVGNFNSYEMYNAADIVGTGVLLMAFVGSSTDVQTNHNQIDIHKSNLHSDYYLS